LRRPMQTWAVRDGARVVATAKLWSVHAPKYRAEIAVDVAHRRHGHGTRLLEQVLATARAAQARSVQVRLDASDADSIAWASRRGFVETNRTRHLELVLAEAQPAPYRAVMDGLAADGIAIVTLADFIARTRPAGDPYLDVFLAVRDGWPDPDPDLPGDEPTVVDWAAMLQSQRDSHVVVAEQAGRLVGFASALGTGVVPELRGRGVGTALKIAAIDSAIARGETVLRSPTSSPAMLHINAKLGFRERSCELRMVRRLHQA